MMYGELKMTRQEQSHYNQNVMNLTKSIDIMNGKIGRVAQTTDRHTEFMKMLAYKVIDMAV